MQKLIFAALLLLAAPLALAAPADGKGNKFVEYYEEYGIPIFCDADETPDLTLDIVGWLQGHEFKGKNNPNVELTVYHFDLTYTNALGEQWTWKDRGPDRLYFVTNEDGVPELHIAISGRSGYNIIGHVVLNLATWEIVVMAGQHPFGGEIFGPTSDDFACEFLYFD